MPANPGHRHLPPLGIGRPLHCHNPALNPLHIVLFFSLSFLSFFLLIYLSIITSIIFSFPSSSLPVCFLSFCSFDSSFFTCFSYSVSAKLPRLPSCLHLVALSFYPSRSLPLLSTSAFACPIIPPFLFACFPCLSISTMIYFCHTLYTYQ